MRLFFLLGLQPVVEEGAGAFGAAKVQARGDPFNGHGRLFSHADGHGQLIWVVVQPQE